MRPPEGQDLRVQDVQQHAEKKLEGMLIQQQERSMGSESP
jgi:hypothetical protein